MSTSSLTSVEDALALVRTHRPARVPCTVSLDESVGRRLAGPVSSPLDFPLFDNAAMDGYAVAAGSGTWELVGEVAAGVAPSVVLKPGQAVRIFTGAPVPEGTVSVLPQEEAEVTGGWVNGPTTPGAHLRRRGEELSAGSLALAGGMRITPPVAAALAAMGLDRVDVLGLPRTAVLSTGNEIVPPGLPLRPGTIYNSNATAVSQTLCGLGVDVEAVHVGDDPVVLQEAAVDLLGGNDVLVTTGGVSVGDYDYLVQVVREIGLEVHFHGVAMKPGKPIGFGTRDDGKVWLGLPGNPMSAMVGLLVFGLTILHEEIDRFSRPLAHDVHRRGGRDEFVPCSVNPGGQVVLQTTVGSHAAFGLVGATGLAVLPATLRDWSAGAPIEVLPLPWSHS